MKRPSCPCPGPDECPSCAGADAVTQAIDFLLANHPGTVSGQGGCHTGALRAASAAVVGFGLSTYSALAAMRAWNATCMPPWSEKELAHKVASAEKGAGPRGGLVWRARGGSGQREESAEAVAARKAKEEREAEAARRRAEWGKAREFDPAAAAALAGGAPVGRALLRAKSAVDPVGMGFAEFCEGLYLPGERLLLFDTFQSQGQWIYEVGKGWWQVTGTKAKPSTEKTFHGTQGPRRSQREGMWYLVQPVTGGWKKTAEGDYTRRSEQNVARFPYMVLESDIAGHEETWLTILARAELPIVAMYTSGGISVHALVRVDAKSKEDWDDYRQLVRPVMTALGADKNVFSAVRLSRACGFLREGSEKGGVYKAYAKPRGQNLLYYRPQATGAAILTL